MPGVGQPSLWVSSIGNLQRTTQAFPPVYTRFVVGPHSTYSLARYGAATTVVA